MLDFSLSSESSPTSSTDYDRIYVSRNMPNGSVLLLHKLDHTSVVNSSWFVVEIFPDTRVSVVSPLNDSYTTSSTIVFIFGMRVN